MSCHVNLVGCSPDGSGTRNIGWKTNPANLGSAATCPAPGESSPTKLFFILLSVASLVIHLAFIAPKSAVQF